MSLQGEETKPLHVLVVGAGIAGLTAAIALGKQGHDVVILEKSRFSRETGAAIALPPNCTALLEWMDASPTLYGGTLLEEMHRYGSGGELRHKQNFSEIRKMWQAEWYLAHRVDLHNHLKYRAQQTATLHTGCNITQLDLEGERPTVKLDDGREFSCDLLLGADGLRSVVRETMAPGHPPPYPTGKSCFRWLLPTDSLKQADATREIVGSPGTFIEWAAGDRRVVVFPCSNNKILNLVGYVPNTEAGDISEGWQASGNKHALIQAFSKFNPAVRAMTESAGDDLKIWQLFDMKALPSWQKRHSALLGDAAHPFQPHIGQGGAMGIEDAVSLATLLPKGTRPDEIPSRLVLYEKARRERVEYVLKYTRLNGVDEDDTSARRMTMKEVMQMTAICFSHKEIESSRALLASSIQAKQ
ncbi:FAD/NAD(P)-binding domain-containing protein [Aspergillus floccosus]